LLEYETLSGDEIKKVLAGDPIDRGGDAEARQGVPAAGSSIPNTRRPRGGGIGGPAQQGA
jgi:cell division protease FtsH